MLICTKAFFSCRENNIFQFGMTLDSPRLCLHRTFNLATPLLTNSMYKKAMWFILGGYLSIDQDMLITFIKLSSYLMWIFNKKYHFANIYWYTHVLVIDKCIVLSSLFDRKTHAFSRVFVDVP